MCQIQLLKISQLWWEHQCPHEPIDFQVGVIGVTVMGLCIDGFSKPSTYTAPNLKEQS